MDKSGANLAALEALNAERPTPIKIRQNKYLNNVVEQDHRAIKRICGATIWMRALILFDARQIAIRPFATEFSHDVYRPLRRLCIGLGIAAAAYPCNTHFSVSPSCPMDSEDSFIGRVVQINVSTRSRPS